MIHERPNELVGFDGHGVFVGKAWKPMGMRWQVWISNLCEHYYCDEEIESRGILKAYGASDIKATTFPV